MDKKLFGTRINKARKDRGLTAEKLAEACNINSTYLRQIEGGKKLPSLPVFATLCRELRVSPNYILPDLVEGTEAEKIQKIFSESDPTPSQIEMLAEMAGVILKERYLAEKPYGVNYRDFLDVTKKEIGTINRVVMNPPFTRHQDIDHVRHAYDLLDAGGVLVAIMCESTFFRSDKKSVEFRDFLGSVYAQTIKLEPGGVPRKRHRCCYPHRQDQKAAVRPE